MVRRPSMIITMSSLIINLCNVTGAKTSFFGMGFLVSFMNYYVGLAYVSAYLSASELT